MSTQLDEETLALLAAYAEGELDGDDKDTLERRIAAEPALAEELAAMRSLQASLQTMARDDAPEDFARSVAQRIRRRSGGRFFRHDMDRPRVSIELVLMIAAVVFGLLAVVHTIDTVQILTDSPVVPAEPEHPREGSGAAPNTATPEAPEPDSNEQIEAPALDDGVGMPDRDAVREGVVSGGRYAGATRRERVYVIRTELDADALEAEIRRRAGRDVYVRQERGFTITAEAGDVPLMVERLTPLGNVSIETIDFRPGAEQTPAQIVVVPSR